MPATRERFDELCSRIATLSAESVEEAWTLLEEAYSEQHRHYHNFDHVSTLLKDYDEVGGGNLAIEFAIWFHDIVYDPKSGTNEEDSAALFDKWSADFLESKFRSDVTRLIRATDPRQSRTDLPDETLLCDLDLLVLSANPEIYQQYVKNIRKEYHFVPEEKFREGRSRILEDFLKGKIYRSDHFSPREELARENLNSELAGLNPD